jgi:hypothetical protein
MFERFDERSRRVVVLAQEEARMLGHGHIGTEHLLLGLIHEESGGPATALTAAGVTLDAARARVTELTGTGGQAPTGHILFTHRAKRVLELALREALELRQSYIRPEHMLLGLIRERNGAGAQVLERLGGPLPALRQRVLDAAKDAPADPGFEFDFRLGRRVWNWPPDPGLGPDLRIRNEPIVEFRHLITSLDQRLSNIEEHLGIAPEAEMMTGFRGLLLSVDRHLARIERHLGITPEPEAAQPADAQPGAAEREAGNEGPAASAE